MRFSLFCGISERRVMIVGGALQKLLKGFVAVKEFIFSVCSWRGMAFLSGVLMKIGVIISDFIDIRKKARLKVLSNYKYI